MVPICLKRDTPCREEDASPQVASVAPMVSCGEHTRRRQSQPLYTVCLQGAAVPNPGRCLPFIYEKLTQWWVEAQEVWLGKWARRLSNSFLLPLPTPWALAIHPVGPLHLRDAGCGCLPCGVEGSKSEQSPG